MSDILFPTSEEECARLVREAKGRPIAIIGANTRAGLGRPVQAETALSTAKLSGITLYEPSEMVIGAKAGTPLSEIEAALDAKGQMLPFEPMDHRLLYKTSSLARDASGKPETTFPHPALGSPTIGAIAAGNISGPRRLWAGACRDHLIGVRFVNGQGEIIKSGGRVMKNVTGLDLVKLQAGAFGTLGILTEVIFKVVPKPETVATLELSGLDDARAIAAFTKAVASPFEITGAAHIPDSAGAARTFLRIEGFGFSVDYRAGELAKLLAEFGPLTRIDGEVSRALWAGIRDCAPLASPPDAAIWRLSVKPTEAPVAVAAIRAAHEARASYDWSGGLIWLATASDGDAGASLIRAAAKAARGYATLVRAPDAVRAAVPVFEPEAPAIAALTKRIKASVDPAGILNPGRMVAGI